MGSTGKYNALTPTMCLRLAAPHTWAGPSILTTVFGGLYSIACGFAFSPVIWCLLLAAAVFAQSSVNTLNDWADFRKGTDTVENSDDPTDAVLVYDNPNPRHVLLLGIAYMAVFLVCGVTCMVWSGSAVPLVLGIVGAIVIVCYSSGKVPISYLPLGEVVSGVVMGCLIPLADICIFAAATYGGGPFDLFWQLDWVGTLIATAPFVLGVGLVMATQNNCDIERDKPVGRRTLAVLLGRARSVVVYRVFVVFWVAVVAHLCFWNFMPGAWAAVVLLVFGLPTLKRLLTTPLTHEVRGPSMGAVNKANLFVNGAYIVAVAMALVL